MYHPAKVGSQFAGTSLGTLHLTGMGITTLLMNQLSGQTVVVLAKLDIPFLCFIDQPLPGTVIESRIGGKRISFSWTVVSTLTRLSWLCLIAFKRRPAPIVSFSSSSPLSHQSDCASASYLRGGLAACAERISCRSDTANTDSPATPGPHPHH